jgi:5-methylcytosine-specific restriction protein B
MARFTDGDRDLIDGTVERWKENCLLEDGSVIFDDRPGIWAADAVGELYTRFNDNQLEGDVAGGNFASKWDAQLEGATSELRLLAAELLLVHFLFASSVTKQGKLSVIERTLAGTDIELPQGALAIRALGQNIGHPGIGFNTRRDIQIAYLIDFVRRFKALDGEARLTLLTNAWELRDFADDTTWPVREMRHILLHLLAPDEFERISSGTHKREIASAFDELLGENAPADVDERLLTIRGLLEGFLPDGNTHKSGQVDFYFPPLHGVWEATASGEGDGTGDLEALEWKKQIVFYGPPGTSKTWQARRLAETVVRRAALSSWGPEAFFSNTEVVDGLVEKNIFWLQLHPGYGYEQFIRGLRLEGNETHYRPGYLPHLVEQLAAQDLPEGLEPLPGVLVLDEINRTNLSEMLGEAFSLLERDQRGRKVELPGFDAGQAPDELVIPAELYVIGTMNEIDQSVETLDFALRRRFLWRECPFERDTLLAIIADRWGDDVRRYSYDDAAVQLERFADRAQALNDAIESSDELGRQYQVGHTYFADVAFFIGPWARARKAKPGNGTYLWTAHGNPQPPLTDLWDRSLRPLLEQYLAGSDVREDELAMLRQTFLAA